MLIAVFITEMVILHKNYHYQNHYHYHYHYHYHFNSFPYFELSHTIIKFPYKLLNQTTMLNIMQIMVSFLIFPTFCRPYGKCVLLTFSLKIRSPKTFLL